MSRLYGSVWDARSALLHRGGKVPHEHPSQSLRPVVSTALSQTTIQPHNVHQLRSSPKVSFSWSAANQTRLNPHTFATDFRSSSSGNYEFIQPSFQFKNLTSNNISFYDESKNVGANEESGGDEWSWQSSFPTGEHSIGTSQLSGTSLLPSTPPTFVSSSPLFHSQTGVPSPCLPGQVMSLTTWMSHYRDNGVLVEYVHNHARQLGLLDGPSTERVGYWRIQTKLHEGETETLLVPATRVTFQWPQRHLNTIYCYRLDDIPHLLLMCQELSEKFRPQGSVQMLFVFLFVFFLSSFSTSHFFTQTLHPTKHNNQHNITLPPTEVYCHTDFSTFFLLFFFEWLLHGEHLLTRVKQQCIHTSWRSSSVVPFQNHMRFM
jgi:hypothetical protein